MLKRQTTQQHNNTMTKNGIDIQTILSKRTEKEKKANPSHFFKFLLASPHGTHLVLPDSQSQTFCKIKRAIFCQRTDKYDKFDLLTKH
jgi:hypothetical protein